MRGKHSFICAYCFVHNSLSNKYFPAGWSFGLFEGLETLGEPGDFGCVYEVSGDRRGIGLELGCPTGGQGMGRWFRGRGFCVKRGIVGRLDGPQPVVELPVQDKTGLKWAPAALRFRPPLPMALWAAEKAASSREPCPQRLKPNSIQSNYRSGKPLRHPKSSTEAAPLKSGFKPTCSGRCKAQRHPKPKFADACGDAMLLGGAALSALRFRPPNRTALAAAVRHPAPSQLWQSCEDTPQQSQPALSSQDSDECTAGRRSTPASPGRAGHGNSSPIFHRQNLIPSWHGMKIRP